MKNFKRVAALAMAATMVVGSGFTAMAAETGGTPTPGTGGSTGTGSYEGYVEETSVFTVDVPTDASATKGFNFFVDPNGLLAGTNYARISGATAADFESGASLFFERTPDATATPAVVKYGKDSEAITLTNKSSYAVNVEVSATVAGADKINLGDVADDTTDPTIQLAIVSGEDTPTEAKITADGGKLTGTIEGETTNFKTKWNSTTNKYEYGLIDTPDNAKWKTYSFHLTGACGGTWTADQAEVEPTVTLTWKVTDPKATPNVLTLENGVLTARIKIADFKSGSLKIGDTTAVLGSSAGSWGGEDDAVTFTFNSTWANAMKGKTCVATVVLQDDSEITASFDVAAD